MNISRRKLVLTFAALCGLALVATAVFAIQLGIDNDPGWGRGRQGLLAIGIILLAWVAAEPHREALRTAAGRIFENVRRLAIIRLYVRARLRIEGLSDTGGLVPVRALWSRLALPAALLLALFTYNWVFTAGRITDWPAGSRYFHRLGEAFRAGQLHLLEQPSPELQAARNPYFYLERGDVPVLWDALFYRGRYYLYWGPVPGLIVAALQPFSDAPIRDAFLVSGFLLGYLVFTYSLLSGVTKRFSWLPRRMIPAGFLAITLPGPVLWLFSRPNVYEAAISGGQFFLMAGLYFAFTAFNGRSISPARLALAGASWGLAASTRVNLSLVIAFSGLLVIQRVWSAARRSRRNRAGFFRPAAAFCLPLLAAAAGLMFYNRARFGSPFDFGYNYLITGPTIPADPARKTSLDYVIPNLYQYALRPPHLSAEFPYITIPWIKNDMWPNALRLPPDYYYSEPVASLFLTVPLVGLGLLAGLRKGWLRLNGFPPPISIPSEDRSQFGWLKWHLTGNILLTAPILLTFTQNTYRYLADLTPAAVLLSILLLGEFLSAPPGLERSVWMICWRLGVLATIMSGVLIAVTGYQNAFEELNPLLYQNFLRWFP